MNVDAIKQWPRNPIAVTLDLFWRAAAFPASWITKISAGARVHRGDQHHIGREGYRACRSADGNFAVLQRLPQDFERRAFELGKLVKKEHSVMSKAHFARSRIARTSDETDVGNCMMWRTERSLHTEGIELIEETTDAVNLGRFDRLFDTHRRHNRGNAFGEHGLAASRRPNEQQGVISRYRDPQSLA